MPLAAIAFMVKCDGTSAAPVTPPFHVNWPVIDHSKDKTSQMERGTALVFSSVCNELIGVSLQS